MSRIRDFFKKISDWLFVGKRLPLFIAAFVIVAVTVTVIIVASNNKTPDDKATVFVTLEGFGDKDFSRKPIKINGGDTVKEVFSLKYPEIYNDFGKPYIEKNEFTYFMGIRKTPDTSFQVTIDGLMDSNLENAYLHHGQSLVIKYMKK